MCIPRFVRRLLTPGSNGDNSFQRAYVARLELVGTRPQILQIATRDDVHKRAALAVTRARCSERAIAAHRVAHHRDIRRIHQAMQKVFGFRGHLRHARDSKKLIA